MGVAMSDELIDDLIESIRIAKATQRSKLSAVPNLMLQARRDKELVNKVAETAALEKAERPGKHVEHVYCIRFGDGPVKFGYSANLGARVRVLGASHWMPITLLGAIMGDRKVEQTVHEAFSSERIERTEWFQPSERVVEFAKRMCARELLPEVQSSLDMYECTPIEEVYAGTKGQPGPV